MLNGSASAQDWTHLEAIAHTGPTTKGLYPMLVAEMIASSFESAWNTSKTLNLQPLAIVA